MNPYLARLAGRVKLKNVPQWMLRLVERRIDVLGLRGAKWIREDPYANGPEESDYDPAYPYRLGILKEMWHRHWPYIQACRDLKVAYRTVDLSAADWMDRVRESGCDAFLVWPSVELSVWKQMFDERLRILAGDMKGLICPTVDEIWLHESKRRTAYWLTVNRIPHAQTWVFYQQDEALEFARRAELPLVFKPDRGSGATGVRIFRTRPELLRHLRRYFRVGELRPRDDWRDRQWGSVLLQEYVPAVAEWRVIRIGESYFANQKGRLGEFFSGSHVDIFADPPAPLLDLIRSITDRFQFSSMSFDVFETSDGTYLVNEMHPVFGRVHTTHEMEVAGKPGRYLWDSAAREWRFEEGIFTENSCCNLRVRMLIQRLEAGAAARSPDRLPFMVSVVGSSLCSN